MSDSFDDSRDIELVRRWLTQAADEPPIETYATSFAAGQLAQRFESIEAQTPELQIRRIVELVREHEARGELGTARHALVYFIVHWKHARALGLFLRRTRG